MIAIRLLVPFTLVATPALLAQTTPGPRRVEPVEHPAVQQRLSESHAGYQAFLREVGGVWQAHFDELGGTPGLIVGNGVPVSQRPIESLDEAERAARGVLERCASLWGATLEELELVERIKLRQLFVFTWQQRYRGLDVLGARVQIQVHEVGRVAALSTSAVAIDRDLDVASKIDRQDALACVLAGKTLHAGDSIDIVDLVIHVEKSAGTSRPRLAHVVDVDQPSAGNAERVYVGAVGCEILEVEPRRYDATVVHGTVQGVAKTGLSPLGGFSTVGLAGVEVEVQGVGITVTDAFGAYSITTPQSGPFTVSASLQGPQYVVNNFGGAGAVPEVSTTYSGSDQFSGLFFNASLTDLETAQVNAAWHHAAIRTYAQAKLQAFSPWANQPITVNATGCANNYFPGTHAILLGAKNVPTCENLSFSTMIYHEFGHGVDDSFGGMSSSAALAESLADVLAMYGSGQPIIGQDYKGLGTFVRTGENAKTWPATGCFLAGDPHCVGEPFMGYAWQVRKNLTTSLGAAAGAAVAEADLLGLFAANSQTILEALTQSFVLDDDDGDLTNGTPHYVELAAAATLKGFTPPPVSVISLSHTPHPDTYNQSQPYDIFAQVGSSTGATIATVELSYALGTGALTSVSMPPTGQPSQYKGQIPAQIGPQTVAYRIRVVDSNGYERVLPGPQSLLRFAVGKRTTLFFDDLEGSVAGWTKGGTQNDWEIGFPQALAQNDFDPIAPYSGAKCWGNDLQTTSASNGLYAIGANNFLRSPSLSASALDGVRLRFRRWLTVEKGANATIRVNNAQVFSDPVSSALIDHEWMLEDVAAAPADFSSAFQVEWRLQTSHYQNAGGWNVDDVEVYALQSTPVLGLTLGATNPTPPIGSSLQLVLQGTPNSPWTTFISSNAGPLTFAGIGVVSVGADLLAVASGSLDAAGAGSLPLYVPNDPALIGQQQHWIAVIYPSGALPQVSNATVTTIQ